MSDTVNKDIRAKRRRDPSAVLTALPNLLTYGRIAAVPALAACLFWDTDQVRWIALAIYVVACVTDFFDGHGTPQGCNLFELAHHSSEAADTHGSQCLDRAG